MSLVLGLIAANKQLSSWRNFAGEHGGRGKMVEMGLRVGFYSDKKIDNIVDTMVAACSHPDAVELIAREWETLPSLVRTTFTRVANEATSTRWRSNNVTKGISRLNERLGGAIFSRVDDRPTTRDLRVVDGRLVSTQRRVNIAAARAEQAFGGFGLPQNYKQLPPAAKRRLRKQLAKDRKSR